MFFKCCFGQQKGTLNDYMFGSPKIFKFDLDHIVK